MDKKIIKVGNQPYEVKYTFGAFDAMHRLHGINVFDLPNPTPRLIAVLIWGAIIHVDPQITPEVITSKLSMEEAMNGNLTCIEAILVCLPKKPATDGEQKSA